MKQTQRENSRLIGGWGAAPGRRPIAALLWEGAWKRPIIRRLRHLQRERDLDNRKSNTLQHSTSLYEDS